VPSCGRNASESRTGSGGVGGLGAAPATFAGTMASSDSMLDDAGVPVPPSPAPLPPTGWSGDQCTASGSAVRGDIGPLVVRSAPHVAHAVAVPLTGEPHEGHDSTPGAESDIAPPVCLWCPGKYRVRHLVWEAAPPTAVATPCEAAYPDVAWLMRHDGT
jgi:hypothetical protein